MENIGIKNNVDAFALNKAKKSIEQTTIIAYDLTDISKENSRKMEKISTVFDGSKRKIYAKAENLNMTGSIKDRMAFHILKNAYDRNILKKGSLIIEATSGNTGIGLALACAVKGYKSIFVVTDKVSTEKINYLKALGGDVIVVSNAVKQDSPEYYINVAKRINKETPNSLFMYQYSNPANPEIHYRTTGPEIWDQTEGKITHFVSGIGTGGTISGVGKYLKEKNKKQGSLFWTYHNEPFTTNKLFRLITEFKEKKLFRSDWCPLDLRHSFAVNFLASGGDMKELQYILGHGQLFDTKRLYGEASKEVISKSITNPFE